MTDTGRDTRHPRLDAWPENHICQRTAEARSARRTGTGTLEASDHTALRSGAQLASLTHSPSLGRLVVSRYDDRHIVPVASSIRRVQLPGMHTNRHAAWVGLGEVSSPRRISLLEIRRSPQAASVRDQYREYQAIPANIPQAGTRAEQGMPFAMWVSRTRTWRESRSWPR